MSRIAAATPATIYRAISAPTAQPDNQPRSSNAFSLESPHAERHRKHSPARSAATRASIVMKLRLRAQPPISAYEGNALPRRSNKIPQPACSPTSSNSCAAAQTSAAAATDTNHRHKHAIDYIRPARSISAPSLASSQAETTAPLIALIPRTIASDTASQAAAT